MRIKRTQTWRQVRFHSHSISGIMHCQTSEQQLVEEVCGLPDNVVAEKSGSDIIERLMGKKQRNHTEAVAELHDDLSLISVEYETLYRKSGQELLHHLSVHDDNVGRQMQRIESISDLEKFTLQELHELWDIVNEEFVTRRKRIEDLGSALAKYEYDRIAMIAALLRKYTGKLEKISLIMPLDIHRLMDGEAMMINQALLANRRALAKLQLNLMESHLQNEYSYRLRWEDKLDAWQRVKVLGVVSRFKEFIASPGIQCPKDVQAVLNSMHVAQQSVQDQRITILRSVMALIPPRCSKSLVTEWYKALSCVNEKIDCMHTDSMRKLQSLYENTWQECLSEAEQLKNEFHTCGISPEEIQNIVNAEFLPRIGKCQSEAKEGLAAMDKAFESLAKSAAALSKSLFKFMRGASHLWEVHSAGLRRREQQLQDQLDRVRYSQDHGIQEKEAHLDVLLDQLRQESTEEALKMTLEKTIHFLDDVKHVYIHFYKEEMDTVDGYPAMVLEELQSYSSAVSRFFNVKEIYSQPQDSEELRSLTPDVNLDLSDRATVQERPITGQGRKQLPEGFQKSPAHSSFEEYENEDDIDSPQEFVNSQSSESFVTSKGNVYNGQSFISHWDMDQEPIPSEMEAVVFPKSLLVDLQKNVRLLFFNYLEEEYQMALTSCMDTVAAKKVALKSEQDLRLHLHHRRAERIRMDIHNVRAAELVLHRDRVEGHCKGVLQALATCRTNVQNLQIQQHKLTEDFRSQIYSMDDVFNTATKSDMLVGLCGTLQSNLEKHMNVIQESQRHFRQTLEAKLDGLRKSNVQLMKSFNLFSEGGNFTPKEIEMLHKQAEKMSKRIDFTDEAIMLDMEGTESKCLEQAKDVVNRFEERIHFLIVDLKFLEKIQGLLTNTQVQLKTEVSNSNMQQKKINCLLTELETMVNYFAISPEKTVTTDDIFAFTQTIFEEFRTQCHYLECFLDPTMAVPMPDCALQGAFAVAARPKSRKQDKSGSPATDSLLQPSRMGVPLTDDVVVGVVKGLLRLGKPKVTLEAHSDSPEKGPAAVAVTLTSPGQRLWKSPSAESISARSLKRLSKPTRFDKRFQVFGPKPEEHAVTAFKGVIVSILWKTNDILLQVAEEFYKQKERRPVTRPQYLQETFEQCAEEINKRLLVYQSQTQDYHNNSLQEFRQQLTNCEECLSKVPGLLITNLGEQHLRRLGQDTGNIRQQLAITLQESEERKKKHSRQLSVRLSHPACEKELDALKSAEEDRQRELTNAVSSTYQELLECVRKHGEEFVSAVSALTQNLLFQMDNLLIVDEVQVGQTEMKTENVPALIRRKKDVILLEENQSGHLVQRGSRTWPGISFFGSSVCDEERPCKETASVRTIKTTLVHLRAVEARDSLYLRYEQKYREEQTRAMQENQAQKKESQCWEEHWRELLDTLSQLNAE